MVRSLEDSFDRLTYNVRTGQVTMRRRGILAALSRHVRVYRALLRVSKQRQSNGTGDQSGVPGRVGGHGDQIGRLVLD